MLVGFLLMLTLRSRMDEDSCVAATTVVGTPLHSSVPKAKVKMEC